ncbi:MAG: PBP1A family penicillin-binding protein, partial [Deferribacteraceae bacterium]|nr:PBP1A family penicillin-binding protein [Deferribacteraceae bacterium]
MFGLVPIFFGSILAVIILSVFIYKTTRDIPSIEELTQFRLNQPSMVYDAKGRVIAELGTERRYPIHISEMPMSVRLAVVAVEDARFFEHNGIDLLGIIRATLKNIKAGRFAEGGSTLTQQLVKNIFLSPEKKIIRKFKEAVIAYQLDKYLTKDEILEYYLNQVNFGRGGYGIQAASINYFGKNAKDLTLHESALLAGIPRSPRLYSPHITKNAERSVQRRNHVLLRMYENAFITEDEYLNAIEEPLAIIENPPTRQRFAEYFLDYVLKYITEDLAIEAPQNRGLKVYTTLDMDFQEKAEAAVRNNLHATSTRIGYFGPAGHLSDLDNNTPALTEYVEEDGVIYVPPTIDDLLEVPSYLKQNGFNKAIVTKVESSELAIAFQDNTTGRIKLSSALWAKPVNSKDRRLDDFKKILKDNDIIYVVPANDKKEKDIFLLVQDPPMEASLLAVEPMSGAVLAMVGGYSFEKTMFNRATQAKRQVGSVFKPIVYSVALEEGLQPMSKILDAPIISQPDENGMIWRPKNIVDEYRGETTLKEGVTKSINVVTIKMSEKLGIKKILSYAKSFGITSELANDFSITIGSGSISLLEIVYAYSVFPNMGTRCASPYFITKIEDADGTVLFEFSPPEHVQVLKPYTAQIMTDILMNVVQNGTASRAKVIRRPIGAKTGTSNKYRDAWFVGFLPNLVVGVWTG